MNTRELVEITSALKELNSLEETFVLFYQYIHEEQDEFTKSVLKVAQGFIKKKGEDKALEVLKLYGNRIQSQQRKDNPLPEVREESGITPPPQGL